MANLPYIQGVRPDSWNEVYFAQALDKFQIPYQFQKTIIERAGLRGSITVDFVVYNPFPQPVEIFGQYWHEGELGADDRLKLILTKQRFGREVIVVWSDEIPDQDAADKYVQERFV